MSATDSNHTSRRRVTYLELRGWVDECLQRHRSHVVGVTGGTGESLHSTLEPFLERLRHEGWIILTFVGNREHASAHQTLSALLLETEMNTKIPEHFEITPHHQLSSVVDISLGPHSLQVSRNTSVWGGHRGHAFLDDEEEAAWRSLELKLPEERRGAQTPQAQESSSLAEGTGAYPATDLTQGASIAPKASAELSDLFDSEPTAAQKLWWALCKFAAKQPVLLYTPTQEWHEEDLEFFEGITASIRAHREQGTLLLITLNPPMRVDDEIKLKVKLTPRLQVPLAGLSRHPFSASDQLDEQALKEERLLNRPFLLTEHELGLNDDDPERPDYPSSGQAFDQVFEGQFEEVFATAHFAAESDASSDHTVAPDRSKPHEVIELAEHTSPPVSQPHAQSNADQTQETPQLPQHISEQSSPDLPALELPSPEHLPELIASSPQPEIPSQEPTIERGEIELCFRQAEARYDRLGPLLIAIAAAGPTASMGQVQALWRGVVERPLDEELDLAQTLDGLLDEALTLGVLAQSKNNRFPDTPSFRISDGEQMSLWRARWSDLLSSRLRRRAHRNLAGWMARQPVTEIARPQLSLTLVDHWIEAGELYQAALTSLELSRLFLSRGEGRLAKKTLQRTVQFLGPEGPWGAWRDALEQLLKLNLESGDQVAAELISRQLIERAWRLGEISFARKLCSSLEHLYQKTHRPQEAKRIAQWAAHLPLEDQVVALFDRPITAFPIGSAELSNMPLQASALSVSPLSVSPLSMYPLSLTPQGPQVTRPASDRASRQKVALEQRFDEAELRPSLFSSIPLNADSEPASQETIMPLPDVHTLEAPPLSLLQALVTLHDRGYEAYVVGGSVRDRLLGRTVNDWDVATSALPEEVSQCFEKVIETGIQHGTVTVVIDGEHIEVTTYRIDGAYHDGRRPEEVSFTRSLHKDLLRRDFTVNAIAWDPINAQLEDPYQGVKDLQKKVLRAVGDSRARFQEDGLRVLRAVRFATVLNFEIDPATLRGAQAATSILRQVSAERIQVELFKMLKSPHAGRGLQLMRELGTTEVCLPQLPHLPESVWDRLVLSIQQITPDVVTALTLIFHAYQEHIQWSKPDFAKQVKRTLKKLKVNNRTLAETLHLITFTALDPALVRSDAQVRALAAEIGVDLLTQVWAYREAWLASAPSGDDTERQTQAWRTLRTRMTQLQVEEAPQSVRDLKVNGHDLCDALDLFPSKEIGELLQALLRWVWEDPARNNRERLLFQARMIARERGMIEHL